MEDSWEVEMVIKTVKRNLIIIICRKLIRIACAGYPKCGAGRVCEGHQRIRDLHEGAAATVRGPVPVRQLVPAERPGHGRQRGAGAAQLARGPRRQGAGVRHEVRGRRGQAAAL